MPPLWAHQVELLKRASKQNSYGLFLEMGTGKTRCAIEIMKQKCREHGRQLKALVLAPSVVCSTWKKEIAQYWDIDPKYILVLFGTADERRRMLDRTPNYFIVVMNYESLLMDPVFIGIRNFDPDILIADESHRIKNPKAQRTKRAFMLSDRARFKYILSGTPVTNNEADLFSQFYFMDNGQTFGKSFFAFRNAWFTDKNAQKRKFSPAVTWPDYVPKPHRAEEFRNKVMSKAMSVTKAECLSLPPYMQQTIEVGMSKDQEKHYKSMKNDFITFVNSQAFSAELAVTKAMRLNQVVAGFLMNTEGETHTFKNTPKDKALLDLIEDAASKVVVWCVWKENQKHLAKLFKDKKINFRMLVGDQTQTARDENLRDFTDDKQVKVMLASSAAAGIGISLVAANVAIYYSRNFSYEVDAQSAARIHRGGQKAESVTRYDLVVPDTIDASCLEALARKEELKDSIINRHLKV